MVHLQLPTTLGCTALLSQGLPRRTRRGGALAIGRSIGAIGLLACVGCGSSRPNTDAGDFAAPGGVSSVSNVGIFANTGGSPACVWRDSSDAGASLDASAASSPSDAGAEGTCPLAYPSVPTFFASDPQSPCPHELPSLSPPFDCCPPQYGNNLQCIYPDTDPSPSGIGLEHICRCSQVAGSAYAVWYCGQLLCELSGEGCLTVPGTLASGPEVTVSSDCDAGTVQSCWQESDDTAAGLLQQNIYTLTEPCWSGCVPDWGLLTVNFENGCARSMVLSQTTDSVELATFQTISDCLQEKLSNVVLDCARGFSCTATVLGGGVPIMCGDPP